MTRLALKYGAIAVASVLAMAIPGIASANPIVIYGTGLDAAGNALALGALDPHYTVVQNGNAQGVVLNPPNGAYFANDASSEWIWQQANGAPTSVTRTFRTTFDLTGFDETTAVINGLWGTDNQGLAVRLNGNTIPGVQLLGVVTSNFNSLHSFIINNPAYFVAGVNTLEFDVQDDGGVSGFRAQLSGTADLDGSTVPEPATLLLLGTGLLQVARSRRCSKTR